MGRLFFIVLALSLFLPIKTRAGDSTVAMAKPSTTVTAKGDRCMPIEVERLPPLNVPRNYHHTLMVGGEPLVVGALFHIFAHSFT